MSIVYEYGGNAVANKHVEIGYDLASQFDYLMRYDGFASNAVEIAMTDYEFDAVGRAKTIQHYRGNSIATQDRINGYFYLYDEANHVTAEYVLSPIYISESVSEYDYNYRDELTDAAYLDADLDESYVYDDNGNRISADNEDGANTYSRTANNQMSSDGVYAYGYDVEGNRATREHLVDGTFSRYEWDHRNRLASVSDYADDTETSLVQTVTYRYDNFNQILSRTVVDAQANTSERYFVHQDGQVVMQFDTVTASNGSTSTVLTHRYLWGPQVDQHLADERVLESQTMWSLSDRLGTIRDVAVEMTGFLAPVTWKHRRYDSFGEVRDESTRGDFNGDGDYDIDDIDILFDAVTGVSSYDSVLDLDSDADVDLDDVQLLVTQVFGTALGDINLDGSVDGSDWSILASYYGAAGSWGWSQGDLDGSTGGSGEVGGSDFGILSTNYGYTNGQGGLNSTEYVFGFTGRMFDIATGLQNNLNRWYDPNVGRWISKDPIGFAAGDANLYRYVGNGAT